jgi:hypothetical protein
MIVKKTKSRELALTVGEDYVEVVERHYGKYLDKATYGITLRGNVVELWREEEGGGRQVVAHGTLTDGEVEWVREAMVNIRRFIQFGVLFFYLKDRLSGVHADPHL